MLLVLMLGLIAAGMGCARIRAPEGWSGGVIQDETLYIGTAEGQLLALDAVSGETRWKFELLGDEDDRAIYGLAAVTEDALFVGGYDGILYALSPEGDLLWQERVGDAIVGGPTVVGDTVLVGDSSGALYAFDIEEQLSRWVFLAGDKVWSSPAVAEGVAYIGSLDHNVYAVNVANGSELWRFSTGGAVTASPLVVKGRVYVGAFDGVFYALDAATGAEVWRFDGADSWYWSHAIAGEDTLYAPSLDGNLYALELATGRLRWTVETEGPIVGSPAFVFDMIAVPSADGKVRLANIRDGSPVNACNVGEEIRTTLVERDGVVYFGARDRSIRAISITSAGQRSEKWVYFTDRDDPLPSNRTVDC
jgi:outer membrane protein assembly factor BamB